MALSVAQRKQIRREVSAGVPHSEIAQTYGISVAMVLLLGQHRDVRGRVLSRTEPLPGLKELDWRSARPAPRLAPGEGCQALECSEERVRGKSYCADHCNRYFARRVAA